MASVSVTCYRNGRARPYQQIAMAMQNGIRMSGDRVALTSFLNFRPAYVGMIYGWKYSSLLLQHSRYLYADLGYWHRDLYWRFAANGWSPAKCMRRGMPPDRFAQLQISVLPEHGGDYVLVLGASAKSCTEHGLRYMQWEEEVCKTLLESGARVLYRPKPRDKMARVIQGTEFVQSNSFDKLLAGASLVAAHHSNGCVEAIAAGCAVHCATGVASLRSVPIKAWKDPLPVPDRMQFLYDVAYTQWTMDEMRRGEVWQHMRPVVLQ